MTGPTALLAAAASLAVTGACLALAVASGAFESAARTLPLVGAGVWAASFALMLAAAALRYARLRIALPQSPGLDVFTAAALHGSAAALAPGKLGELVLPVLVHRLTGASLVAGAGLLALYRTFDLIAVVAVAALAGALAVGAPLTAVPIVGATLAAPVALRLLLRLPKGRRGRIWALLSSVGEIAARFSLPRLYMLLALTLALWTLLWAAAFIAAAGAGVTAPFAAAGVALAAASAAFASPINGIANAGPFESAFAGAYATLGYAAGPALAAAALLHLCAIAAPLLCLAAGAGAKALLRGLPATPALR